MRCSDTPAVCDSLETLSSDVDGLQDISLEDGEAAVADVEESFDSIRSDLEAVKTDAEAELSEPIAGLESSLDALSTQVDAVRTAGSITAESVTALGEAVDSRGHLDGGAQDGRPGLRPVARSILHRATWAAAAAHVARNGRPSQAHRTVGRATDPLAVGRAGAIEVDRVAPGVGDGGIETSELFLERCSVLGPYRLEKLLEQRSESSHDLHRRRAELADLGESERHELLPAASRP